MVDFTENQTARPVGYIKIKLASRYVPDALYALKLYWENDVILNLSSAL